MRYVLRTHTVKQPFVAMVQVMTVYGVAVCVHHAKKNQISSIVVALDDCYISFDWMIVLIFPMLIIAYSFFLSAE